LLDVPAEEVIFDCNLEPGAQARQAVDQFLEAHAIHQVQNKIPPPTTK